MSERTITEIFEQISQLKVVVVGDLMIDQYIFGKVERISPEAPVPVLSISRREMRLGGAANVALNCKAMGAEVCVASVIGDDEHGHTLRQMLQEQGIDTHLLRHSPQRTTTVKSRVISRGQQMLRLDEEQTDPLSSADEHPFIDATLRFLQIHKPDLLIFEDYNKGVLKANIIQRIIEHCQHVGIVTAVDPKFENFLAYQQVDIFKPNLKEVTQGLALQIPVLDITQLNEVHNKLSEHLQHKVTLITLSEHGIYYCQDEHQGIIPSQVRSLADVSGAGDTVIAVAAMVYAVTKDVQQMADWSNIAAGLVCEQAGVVPVDAAKLRDILIAKS